jgi:hypothetical protein
MTSQGHGGLAVDAQQIAPTAMIRAVMEIEAATSSCSKVNICESSFTA